MTVECFLSYFEPLNFFCRHFIITSKTAMIPSTTRPSPLTAGSSTMNSLIPISACTDGGIGFNYTLGGHELCFPPRKVYRYSSGPPNSTSTHIHADDTCNYFVPKDINPASVKLLSSFTTLAAGCAISLIALCTRAGEAS